ncbi:MAG: hypothetical protein MJ198_01750 [Bacteroidales bacterium]|nr:hypothetical protein [Bacteroidales bacterium]
MGKSDIHIIIKELDGFIRKFYLNEFIKGLILFVLIVAFYVFTISCAEYFAFFPTQVRTIVFYLSLFFGLYALIKFIVIPLFHVCKIGKVISYVDAAKIISKFFPEIKDTLLNTLELASDESLNDNKLAIAAINQKVANLRPIPFESAVDFKKLISYLKYLVVLILIIVSVSIFYPRAFADGAKRIVKYDEYFEKPAPFSFIIDNDSLSVVKGSDFAILMHIEGKYVPEYVNISIGGNNFLMTKKTVSSFEYVIHGCNNSLSFNFSAEEYSSKNYNLTVIPLPQLLKFSIAATVPSYTGLENSVFENTGDLTIPVGTKLSWNVDVADTDSLFFKSDDTISVAFQKNGSKFILNQRVTKNTSYEIIGKNTYLDSVQIIHYAYTVIPDLRPSIQVEQKQDSSEYFTYYFKGEIQDDYGFSSLEFVYFLKDKENESTRVPIEFSPAVVHQQFFYMFDFSQFSKGDVVNYYFEVFDNDAVNGKKSARSSMYDFTIPTQDELEKMQEQYSKQIESSFEQSSSIAQELVKDFDKLKQKLLNENLSEWERKQILNEMHEKQEQIKQQVEQLSQSLEQKQDLKNKLSEKDEEILKKQQEINDLLNSLMDDELKKMMDEFNQMMENYNKDEFIKKSEEMKMSFEELSKQLDRDLELLKRMDVEESVNNTGERLQELAEEQEKLSEELKNSKNNEELQQRLDDLQKELESIEKKYQDTQMKNEELQQKFDLKDFKQQFEEIRNSMQQSKSEQQNGQQSKSSKSMKKAAEQTKELSEDMQGMMQEQMAQQNMEDMANLRQILENLLTFSFEQEDLIVETGKLSFADPKYAEIAYRQNLLRENFQLIKDSLYALSIRVPQISQPINKEIFEIYKSGNAVIDHLEQRQRGLAKIGQQYMMTSANNLSVLLSEVLSSMQQQAAQQMEGQQQCQNPKNSGKGQKPSFQQMKQMQQSLKEQMQQMMKQMKEGGIPSQQMQKQLSEMLMKEQMMKQLGNQMMKDGQLSPEGVQQLKDIQHLMDQTERDIVNQNITPQTIMRQEQILTRLLEAENAEQERDKDKERESKTAVEKKSEAARKMFKQTDVEKTQFDDVLQENSVKLKPQYQKIYSDYIINLNEGE